MAAEMSTGALAMCHVHGRRPSVALLVVRVESVYSRKARGLIRFTCNDGEAIGRAVEQAVAGGEAATVEARSIGTNEQGEVVAEFAVTWSFRKRNSVDSR